MSGTVQYQTVSRHGRQPLGDGESSSFYVPLLYGFSSLSLRPKIAKQKLKVPSEFHVSEAGMDVIALHRVKYILVPGTLVGTVRNHLQNTGSRLPVVY